MKNNDPLNDCSVTIERHVCWGEMDAYQHVNNTVYFRYFEDCRIAYFEQIELHKLMESTGVGPILGSTSCRFRIPLTYPDMVRIGCRVSQLEKDRFVMDYFVVSERHGKLAADGQGTLVAFDYQSKAKALIPPELEKNIRDLEGTRLERP